MRIISKIAGFAAVAIAAALPAGAQTTGGYLLPASVGNTLTVSTGLGGWSFSITNCAETINGVANQTCAGTEVIPTISGSTLSLVFLSSTGGAVESTAPGVLNDIAFTVSTVAPGHMGDKLSSISVAGSAAAGDVSRVSAGTTITTTGPGGATQAPLSVSLAGPTLASQTFNPISNTTTAVVDLRSQGGGALGNASGTITMSSATLTYTAAPEPLSIGLFVTGIAGIRLVRRQSRRA